MKKGNGILKCNWTLPGIFAPIGVWMNSVARRVNRVTVYGGSGRWTDDGLVVTVAGVQVYGTFARSKGIFARAWKRADVDSDWVQMTFEEEAAITVEPGTEAEAERTEALSCLRWTWDYPRII